MNIILPKIKLRNIPLHLIINIVQSKKKKKIVNFGIICIELKIGTDLGDIITNKILKVLTDPTTGKKIIQGQMSIKRAYQFFW